MKCNHTIYALDERGDPIGSWVLQGARQRVACRFCGKFYGYYRDEPKRSKRRPKAEQGAA